MTRTTDQQVCSLGPDDSPPRCRVVTAINETGQTMCKLFVVTRRNIDWGANLLVTPLASGASTNINIQGEVKYRAKNCEGDTIAQEGKRTIQSGQTLHISAKKR